MPNGVVFMQQINLHLPDDLVKFVQRAAERETRTVAGQVRHYVAEAARRAGGGNGAALEPWPPLLEPVTRETLPDVKLKVQAMQIERDKLVAAENKPGGLLPHHQDRLQFLRGRIEALVPHIAAIERLSG